MKRTFYILLILSFCSCKQKEDPRRVDNTMRFSVSTNNKSNSPFKTRALLDTSDDLTWACTPSDEYYNEKLGGNGAIGFYADYSRYDEHGNRELITNIFNRADIRLIHSLHGDSPNNWNFAANSPAWVIGGTYHIRAFYPQTMLHEIYATSNASCLEFNYNTHLLQDDLMIAYNRINTVDAIKGTPTISIAQDPITGDKQESSVTSSGNQFGYNLDFNLSDPIPLFFEHALSAIRIRFGYEYAEEEEEEERDRLLSCYFTNDGEGGLHTTGLLIYGDDVVSPPASDTQQDVENRWKAYRWITVQSYFHDDIPFYQWGEADDAQGIEFLQVARPVTIDDVVHEEIEDELAIAYSKMDDAYHIEYLDNVIQTEHLDPGTRELVMKKPEAPYYNTNDGYLLILPQQAPTNLTLHFTTKKLGEVEVKIPPFTGTDINGDPINDPAADHYYVAGHRYTYTVRIEKTNGIITISVDDWDEIHATEFIDIDL